MRTMIRNQMRDLLRAEKSELSYVRSRIDYHFDTIEELHESEIEIMRNIRQIENALEGGEIE